MKEKKFEKPEIIIVYFTNEDIITSSNLSTYDPYGEGGEFDEEV